MDWIKSIASFAPAVAGMLGGPLAAGAATLVAKALGVTEEELEKINPDDPETKIKLQQLENDFVLEFERIQTQNYVIEVQDRDSARNREIQLKDWTPSILAFLYTLGAFTYIGVMSFYPLPLEKDLVMMVLGFLFAKAGTVVDYYMGSAHRREDK